MEDAEELEVVLVHVVDGGDHLPVVGAVEDGRGGGVGEPVEAFHDAVPPPQEAAGLVGKAAVAVLHHALVEIGGNLQRAALAHSALRILMCPGWPCSPSVTLPTTAAAGVPSFSSAATRSPVRSCATAISRPPEVCASNRIVRSTSPTPSPTVTNCEKCASLRRVPPGTRPSSTRGVTPSSTGTAPLHTSAATPLERAICCRCPIRPKPVTSVAAPAPTLRMAVQAPALSVAITPVASSASSLPA